VTVREALAAAERRLGAAGCETAWLDARVLLSHATGWSETRIVAEGRDSLSPEAEAAFEEALGRRERREPVAYVTGRKEFRSLDFAVDARVLVPRPETELLVESALELLRKRAAERDVGTGSGAIAVSIAHALAEAKLRASVRLVALDRSGEALTVAVENARRLLAPPRSVRFLRSDLTSALRGASVDLVAANPPYVAPAELATAPPELAYEPRLALDGRGVDGLAVVEHLLADSRRVLRPGGRILCEIGSTQGETALRRAESSGFESAKLLRDLSGVARVLVAEVPGASGEEVRRP